MTFNEWFGQKLDEKLVTIAPDKQHGWLIGQEVIWRVRYARFIGSQGDTEIHRPHPEFGVPTAFDFALFLTEIEQRIAARQKEVA